MSEEIELILSDLLTFTVQFLNITVISSCPTHDNKCLPPSQESCRWVNKDTWHMLDDFFVFVVTDLKQRLNYCYRNFFAMIISFTIYMSCLLFTTAWCLLCIFVLVMGIKYLS